MPESGDVLLAGRSIAGLPPETITQAGIGRSFQITNLFPELSVEENIRLAVQGAPSVALQCLALGAGDRRRSKAKPPR